MSLAPIGYGLTGDRNQRGKALKVEFEELEREIGLELYRLGVATGNSEDRWVGWGLKSGVLQLGFEAERESGESFESPARFRRRLHGVAGCVLSGEAPVVDGERHSLYVALRSCVDADLASAYEWLARARDFRDMAREDRERTREEQARAKRARARDAGRRGGSAPKRREWAEKAAEQLVIRVPHGVREHDAWNWLPEAEDPWSFDLEAVIEVAEVYRDGEKIVADLGDKPPRELSRGTFLRNYYRPLRRG